MIRIKPSYFVTIPLPKRDHAEQRRRELIAEGYVVMKPVETDEGWILKYRGVEKA